MGDLAGLFQTGTVGEGSDADSLDLPGVVNAMGKNSVEINQGNLRSANVAVAGERTRLVLNLVRSVGHEVKLDGKDLLIMKESDILGVIA